MRLLSFLFCICFSVYSVEVPDLKSWHVDEGGYEHRFYIESPGEFRLGFVRAMNYGPSEWYDLKFDPEAKSNLLRRDLGDGANGFQGSLFNQVINPHDVIGHIGLAGSVFKDEPKTLKVVEANAVRVIVDTEYRAMLSRTCSQEFKLLTRYAIYATGRIYVKNTLLFEEDYTLTTWRHATVSLGDPQHYAYGTKENGEGVALDEQTFKVEGANWVPGSLKFMQFEQPKWKTWLISDNTKDTITIGQRKSGQGALMSGPYNIGSSETHFGWLRGNDQTNPHSWSRNESKFCFTYWDKSTPAPFTDYARSSVLLVPALSNPYKGSSNLHSWVGFKRHYFGGDFKVIGKKGESVTQYYLIQLGEEGSELLPDIRSSAVASKYAESYLKPQTEWEFNWEDGSYTFAAGDHKKLTVAVLHQTPVIAFKGPAEFSIFINDKEIKKGSGYKLSEQAGTSLIQFQKNWLPGDIVEIK
ncbi:MAG: hypothetical protein MK193_10335 [Lentisphaeria bacterium]|nr:hypothetical protein [Lentisphaeria bacterium]